MAVKQVVVVRKDLNMPVGKIAAQVAHASLKAFLNRRQNDINDDGHFAPPELRGPRLEIDVGRLMTFAFSDEAADWWYDGISRVAVVGCETEAELLTLQQAAAAAGLPNAIQKDLGLTVFNGVHTITTLGIGPASSEAIDKITGHLKLLK